MSISHDEIVHVKPLRLIKPSSPNMSQVENYFKISQEKSWFSNFGPCYEILQNRISQIFGGKSVLIVSNATQALELVLKNNRRKNFDDLIQKYVVAPAYTFAATATAIHSAGYLPLYVDVDLDDWHASTEELETLLQIHSEEIACLLLCSTFGLSLIHI